MSEGALPSTDLPEVSRVAVPRRRRWVLWATTAGVVVALVCAGWVLATRTRSPEQAAADAAPPAASWVTAPVEFRVLSSTLITRGDVRPETAVAVAAPGSVEGEPVITQAVVGIGDDVGEGDRIIEVSGRPVFVMRGDTPVYRALRPSMSGDDVAELQAALTRLGFAPEVDGTYGPATKVAVAEFYAKAGYEALTTGVTEAADLAAAEQAVTETEHAVTVAQRALEDAAAGTSGSVLAQADAAVSQAERALEAAEAAQTSRVALAQQALNLAAAERDRVAADPEAAPGALDQAQLAVNQASAQLEDTRRSTADAVDAAKEALWIAALARNEAVAAADTTEAQETVDAATAARDRAVAARDRLVASSGPTVPQGEIVFTSTLPARVQRAADTVGTPDPSNGGGGVSTSLVELAGGRLIVDVRFRPSEQGLVRPGTEVDLLDEQTDAAYAATVTAIAHDASTGPDGTSGYPATVTPAEPLPANLVGANLRVTITAASTDSPSLVVPLAAISSAADGTTSVQVLDAAGDPVTVPVGTGLSADGWVAITPLVTEALTEGDAVVVGR